LSHWRIVVHALDRTGPPVLARALLGWLTARHPEHTVDVVAVRGGPLEAELATMAEVRVLLDPHAPGVPTEPAGLERIAPRVDGLPSADATLLVSVAAGQALPLLPATDTIVTWSVEAGEDLHWMDAPIGLVERTAVWLAGSRVTQHDLREWLGEGRPIHLAPEFIDRPPPPEPGRRAHRRKRLGGTDDSMLVVGAGIATYRKAPDLFVEVALAHHRRWGSGSRFTWIGGTDDELHPLVSSEARRLAPGHVRFIDSVRDVDAYLEAADVLAHPARLDSFPLICLHAAAVGTPVVAFEESGGVREMFGESFLGAAYPDVTALAGAIETLRDPERRVELAAAQQERVLRHFVTDVAAPTVVDHLVAAAGGHG
jgi:glycosyltransferase involved in cell wall biosynthesis